MSRACPETSRQCERWRAGAFEFPRRESATDGSAQWSDDGDRRATAVEEIRQARGARAAGDALGAAAEEQLTTLARDREQSLRVLRELENVHAAAVAADRSALGESIRRGTAEPGHREVDRAAADLGAAVRRIEAIDAALTKTEDEVADLIRSHREQWLADLERELEPARAAYSGCVDALVEARGRIAAFDRAPRVDRRLPAREAVEGRDRRRPRSGSAGDERRGSQLPRYREHIASSRTRVSWHRVACGAKDTPRGRAHPPRVYATAC